jgi:roadblock/LC7 domain-containing protein
MAAGGTATGAGTFNYGNYCTLRATPNEGYLFLNWSKNGEVVSCNANYSFAVTEEAEIEAVFMPLEGTLIGQGESTNPYLPSYSYYNYTLSQQIYTPEEIGEAGTITSISYYNGGATQTRKYDIYMVHTDKTAFENTTDWITVTEADRVYRGNVNMTKGYWTTIELNKPFVYDGSSNLAIIVDDNTGTWSNSMACRVYSGSGYQAIHIYSDGTNYDPYNPSGYSGSLQTKKNQMILGITPLTLQQTITLAAGQNWFSTYLDITLDDLKTALVGALPGATNIMIKAKEAYTIYNGTSWRGQLNTMDVAQMYMIIINSDCEITLEGIQVDPAEHPVTITNGPNWIGFPFGESMTVTEAFAEFEAVSGDMIKSKEAYATYNGTRWRGALTTLVPGQGYIFNSAASGQRTLVFPTSSR